MLTKPYTQQVIHAKGVQFCPASMRQRRRPKNHGERYQLHRRRAYHGDRQVGDAKRKGVR